MSQKDKETMQEEDILEQMQDEIEEMETSEEKEEIIEKSSENDKTKEILAKTLADFDNYKKRVERDKEEMIFFLKADILKKILPRLDDLERILKNTPEDLKSHPVFEGVVAMSSKLNADLEKMGVKSFDSIGQTVNPDFHDVMTVVPGQESGIIFDEFEKGYLLNDKVLRHAKVIVGA